jgi:hypothetical protein
VTAEREAFDLIERSFRALCDEHRPPALPGSLFGPDLAARVVSLRVGRATLLRGGTPPAVKNRVLVDLVRRARGGEPWRTAVAGVLLPGLRSIIGPLLRAYPEYEAELEAEALAGLFEAVRTTRLDRDRLAMNLIWAARRSADRLLDHELAEANPPAASVRVGWTKSLRDGGRGEIAECDVTHLVWPVVAATPGHPELVLVEAFRAGVICTATLDLIGQTRFGGMSVRQYAERVGLPHNVLRWHRYRAEQLLVQWVVNEKPPCKTPSKPCFRRCGTSEPEPASQLAGARCHVDTERTETEDGTRPRQIAEVASTS